MKNQVKDVQFDKDPWSQYKDIGFQASNIGEAKEILSTIIDNPDCKLLLSFTANMMASGLRGIFKELVDKGCVDAAITTGGSIDHDIIKAYKPYIKAGFQLDDVELHKKGINRIGNIAVPSDRYQILEEKIKPVLEKLAEEEGTYTPSRFIHETARLLDDEDMFIQHCLKEDVPVFSPGLVDSAIGLQIFFFNQERPELKIDGSGDLKKLHSITMNSEKIGGLVLGGGISKHHLIGSNLLRGGLDYAVYLTTASEYDGSLSGARTREAKSWGKINEAGASTTVVGDATVTLPLITYETLWNSDGRRSQKGNG